MELDHENPALIVDDRKAVKAARSRGFLTFGTLTILEQAESQGLLDFDEHLSRLKSTNFHITTEVFEIIEERRRRCDLGG